MSTNSLNQLFSQLLLDWYDLHGRKDLPWQLPRSPYRVWVSEIMLQQTQVQTVIPYFNRFIEHFPDIFLLANADEDEVLSLWSGLGYYSRARNLHNTAKIISDQYNGVFPEDLNILVQLPGIGPSTAAAILSQAFNKPAAILDGNVKRVLSRFFLIEGWPEQAQVKKKLWGLASSCMPNERCADYTQAIMDLGATCCTNKNPQCLRCPVKNHCLAFHNKKQHLYPTKKIKKQRPILSQQFLVLHNRQNQVYLEKRPPTGLWGGLWCLPSINNQTCPIEHIQLFYRLQGDSPKLITRFKHSFSHFHLEITALSIRIESTNNFISESRGQWFTKETLPTLGLAKPTTLILSKLMETGA
ncbi:TPA: A/G-specific adenine glycosylase [Legionella pneumophila]|uniref:Adenine DNA glycosylase n=2 Tax=Legionella pneumophila subsp. pneumophila TaxID=91891 RepID=Q5ZX34_LEGPH|nr:A/G-specific adenine glycosylase [Legionella pneumophila]ERH45334.1 DNA glycosylase [Legionella pneumophila str. Leg01/11]ERI48542.1 DNA glycosylase [Legionella pneumophila str. Leg01/20]AAU26986.1 A/G specific adenine glycosylase [Legionella pneumophila subsp. pneumophila str. Philadelphia 1]AEW51189.1 A/G specific adenine glycosylase [Legionella pneumophila subsp. pneumophila ATCC 43290]AGH54404.1 A/G-specific adenine glycosylase [Legionella pneumophila subsp. pneumophila LPE509]